MYYGITTRWYHTIYLLVAIFLFTALFGCARIPENRNPCVYSSRHFVIVGRNDGLKMRYGVGFINKEYLSNNTGHQWAEWWNEKRHKWCLWEPTWTIGKSWYTAEETGYITIYTSEVGVRLPGEVR
jgi:hypothetical protein